MAINFNKPNEIRDFRNGSWFWIQTHVWRDRRLSKADKVAYGTLTSYANTSQEMYPSITRIAEDSDLSPRQVYRCIKHLEVLGYVIIERNHGRSNLYKLAKTFEAPEEEKRPHPTPDIVSPLTGSHPTPDKSTLGTPDKSTLRTISNITISINKRYSSINKIQESDLLELSKKYNVSLGFVKLKLETLKNYCESKGKIYRNYKSALANFILGDIQREIQHPRKGGVIDGTNL